MNTPRVGDFVEVVFATGSVNGGTVKHHGIVVSIDPERGEYEEIELRCSYQEQSVLCGQKHVTRIHR